VTATDPYAQSDAAYVMGALSPSERREYEEHLTTCARCRDAVAELSGMPALLGLVPAAQVLDRLPDAGPVPDTLLPALVARARRERRRRWLQAGLAAAAAVVVGLVLAVALLPGARTSGTVVALSATQPVPVVATVRLSPTSWGTRLEITCTYTGTARPQAGSAFSTYKLVLLPDGGGAGQEVATWQTIPGREVVADGSTSLRVRDVGTMQLQAGDGTVLLQGRL
jgi:RNA polymerase sigma-70 factor (ECF subfamily)